MPTAGQFDVRAERKGVVEDALDHPTAGEGSEGRRPDEFMSAGAQDDRDAGPGLHKLTDQRRRFVCGDAAADADDDFPAVNTVGFRSNAFRDWSDRVPADRQRTRPRR